jgi:site-specific DNA-methyltransferase (adenine-specific)
MRKEVIGNAELWLGDCRDILPSLPKVDAVITDIPYGKVNRASGGLRNLDKGAADIETCPISDVLAVLAKGASVYVWCGTEQVSELRAGLVASNYSTRLCFWEKSNPSPMNGQHIWLSAIEACVYGKSPGAHFAEFCKAPVWRGPTAEKEDHPTPKPVWLMERQILASVKSGGSVLDAFMGSGTTGVACMNLGRSFIGIEREVKYFDIACARIEAAQNQARLFSDGPSNEPERIGMRTLQSDIFSA